MMTARLTAFTPDWTAFLVVLVALAIVLIPLAAREDRRNRGGGHHRLP